MKPICIITPAGLLTLDPEKVTRALERYERDTITLPPSEYSETPTEGGAGAAL